MTCKCFGRLAALMLVAAMGMAHGYESLQPIDQNPSYLQAKVKTVIHAAGVGIKRRDFSELRNGPTASSLWKAQASESQLLTIFKPFIDARMDLTLLDSVPPISDGPPQVNSDNAVTVKGHYPTRPQLNYSMSFIREGPHLGLLSLSVTTSAPTDDSRVPASSQASARMSSTPPASPAGATASSPPMVPNELGDPAVMAALFTNTPPQSGVRLAPDEQAALNAALHAFVMGVKNRNMDTFLSQDIVSPRWRASQTGAQLAHAYRGTLEHSADVGKFDSGRMIVPHAPVTNPAGAWIASGLIVAADRDLLGFRADFLREAGRLKLVNLVVARSRPVK